MRFFTIFLLVAMALAQGETETTTAAAVVTTVPIPAETTVPVVDGNSTEPVSDDGSGSGGAAVNLLSVAMAFILAIFH